MSQNNLKIIWNLPHILSRHGNFNNNNYNGKNYNNNKYNKFSLIPEDSQEEVIENKISFNNVKKIGNKNDKMFYNNNINNMNKNNNNMGNNNNNNLNNNNLMINYTNNNMMNINNNININNKNFIKKNNFPMIINNSNNTNIIINNIRNPIPQNTNPNFIYYQNQMNPNLNNFYYNNQPQQYMFPENAFSYNNSNISQSQNNNSMNYQNNQSNYNNEKKNKTKKKFKDKIEQKLFIINLDNIINGTDERTTVMIRHIPNKYTSQTLLEELNTICKNKYDFFYLPIDNDNDCNLGYAFINFINPLHIVHFYHIFKARKWRLYKSNKECDLTFAKFQGKSELTANLDKNMNKIEDKKKLPMVFEVPNPPKIDLEKKYYDEIKMNRSDLLKNINWI